MATTRLTPGAPPPGRELDPLQRLAYHGAPAAMSLTRVSDGIFLDANEHMAEMLGYTRDEMIGKNANALGVWRDAPRTDVQAQLQTTGRARNVDLTYYRKDGVQRACIASLDVVTVEGQPALLSVAVDITERKRAEDARSRLLTAVESADDAIMTIDLKAQFLTWNKGAERLFGYTSEDVVGRSASILIPEELPEETQILAQQLAKGEALRDHETKRRRKDGSLADVSVTINLVRDESGALIGYTGVMRDISARKRAEEDAKRQVVARNLVRRILRTLTSDARSTQDSRRTLGRALAVDVAGASIDSTLQAIRDLGLGSIELARTDAPGRFEFHGRDLLEVTKGFPSPTCHIALGLLEAALGTLEQGATLGTETGCQSQGVEHCTFIIRVRPPNTPA